MKIKKRGKRSCYRLLSSPTSDPFGAEVFEDWVGGSDQIQQVTSKHLLATPPRPTSGRRTHPG